MIAPKETQLSICTTYITDTSDLFVLAYKFETKKYYLYMIDLDECNFMESEEGTDLNDIDKAFNFKEETFTYNEEEVEYAEFTQIHIRGESRKENIDFKLQLQVFILHEEKIYRWTPEMSSLEYVCSVSFPRMIPIDDQSFFIK